MSVNWKARTFNANNAVILGKISELVYKNRTTIARTVREWDLELVASFKHKETQAYIFGNDETWILAFCGVKTLKAEHWVASLDTKLINALGGKIHAGFFTIFSDIWEDIWNTLKNERNGRNLWVTGHSLGGALATLTVARLIFEEKQQVNGLYTFGQPRVGDKKFADRFNNDFKKFTHRFENERDLVPLTPPRDMDYRHVGTRWHFDKRGKLNKTRRKEENPLREFRNHIKDLVKLDHMRDHLVSAYLKNLARLVKS